jgi:LysM repeat protein
MGLLSFAIDAGKKLLGLGNDEENIKKEILENNSTMPIDNLDVKIEGDKIVLSGDADAETKAKAALIAGNVKGISEVTFEGVSAEEEYYEIQAGDNLSKVSKKFYGNPNHYNAIFKANKEVIKDMDLIYPGQKIRIPKI